MVIISCLDTFRQLSTLSKQFIILMAIGTSLLFAPCKNDFLTSKYLNVKCDFERIPGGGCHLRESYCSLHTCICKPDYPINIDDQLCIAKYKNVGELCLYSQECQTGSYCANQNGSKECRCKTGYIYSSKNKQCVKGIKSSFCRNDSDCMGEHLFCSITVCECMYGFEWFPTDEVCYKKSKYGEVCDNSINCKVHDEFSECDHYTKQCTCGQFLSRQYALDELTHKCISCPLSRYLNSTNTCVPEKMTVQYNLLDRSSYERNSHQYVYIALSMTPIIVFALIGFIYRYVNPNANFPDNLSDQVLDSGQLSIQVDSAFEYCLQTNLNNLNSITNEHRISDESPNNLCLLASPILPDPPPTYDIASKDLPPPYDEVVCQIRDQLS